ncbi:phosphotransferase [Patescibacteria group bacterium]
MHNFQDRINYKGDLKYLLLKICSDYGFGSYISFKVVVVGYEDLNLILQTSKGKYFIKIFASSRKDKDCQRYVDVIKNALKIGISHPFLYKFKNSYLYKTTINSVNIGLCVMQYIKGKNFYELEVYPSLQEKKFIIKQATLINKSNYKPRFIHDNWAITSFYNQYKEKKQYLSNQDKKLVNPVASKFSMLSITKLPHCFIHGDITRTNTMKDSSGKIYIIDFAVANYYPRIQELAVLLCDIFFNPSKIDQLSKDYKLALNTYNKYVKLTSFELKILPLYVKFAHVMHLLLANYQKIVKENMSKENEYFLTIGRAGLQHDLNV